MPWFKVDDKLHSHAKAARAGVDALGLWVLCGSWSMDHLTDGFVPDYIALRLDPKARGRAARLVAAGLWEVAEKDNDKGWQFHDWDDMQPTRGDVETRREQQREKKRRWREKVSRGADGQFTTPVTPLSPGDSAGTNGGTPRGVLGVVHPYPDPTRPDPTRPDPKEVKETPTESQAAQQRGTRIPEDWAPADALVTWAAEKVPGVDLDAETANFIDYWAAKTGKDATKLDWDRTWQRWMRTAHGRLPTWKREQRRPSDDSWDHLKRDPDAEWQAYVEAERAAGREV